MASISDLIKSKSSQDQARVEKLRSERESLSGMRDAALEEITSKPEQYQRYLTLQGDNIRCSVGNVALTMFQMKEATKIGSIEFWHEQGRYIRDDAMRSGAKVFVPPKTPQRRGYLMGDYYDISQTTGKPMKEQTPLGENSSRMETALASLMNFSPVPIVESVEIDSPAYYDDTRLALAINPEYGDGEIFAALATEITYARIHDKGRNSEFVRDSYKLDAESVGYFVCRRFGVDCPLPDTRELGVLYEGYEPGDRGEALEQLRKTARNMGDGIDKAINPGNRNGATSDMVPDKRACSLGGEYAAAPHLSRPDDC